MLFLVVAIGQQELLAVVKNGLWDDPAVAKAGNIYDAFKGTTAEMNLLDGSAASYLTWRICYLLCGGFFGVLRLVMASADTKGGGQTVIYAKYRFTRKM